MVHVRGAVEPDGRVATEDGVRLIPPNDPGQVAAELDGRLEHAVLVAQKQHVGDPEHVARVALLLFADRGERLSRHAVRCVLVRARVAAGDAHGDDPGPSSRPFGERPADGELLVVRMRVDADGPTGRAGLYGLLLRGLAALRNTRSFRFVWMVDCRHALRPPPLVS